MTLNCNWPGKDPASKRLFGACGRQQYRALVRRWELLARRHRLPQRGFAACSHFQQWSHDSWSEAWVDCVMAQDGMQVVEEYSPDWLAFSIGGAESILTAFDLPHSDVPAFMALAHFVCDPRTTPRKAREIRGILTATALCPDRQDAMAAVRELGARHAIWCLERSRQGSPRPRVWLASLGREASCDEPVRFADLAAADRACRQQRIQ